MEQIQEQMAEMRAQLTEQMNAQMAQFMEALTNVTKGQDDLRVLVENSRRVENGGHSRLFDDVSGRIDDHHDPNEFDRLGGHYNPFNQNHGFPPPPPSRLLGRRDNQNRDNLDFNVENFDQVSRHSADGAPEEAERYRLIEERLRAVEGKGVLGLDINDLGLVPGVRIPPKFKVPSFDKYNGATCPMTHVKAYYRKMSVYSEDEGFLMHFFQDSLAGASLEWYVQLERTHIHSWRDLVEAFIKHYQYNVDMAPNRTQLQSLVQGSKESFKEYAQKWRELAARVQPPMTEREMIDMFTSTLSGHYYLACSASANFSEMVRYGERVEMGLKMGKIQLGASSNSASGKKQAEGYARRKEGNADAIYGRRGSGRSNSQVNAVMIPVPQQQQQHQHGQRSGNDRYPPRTRPHRKIDPIPMTYAQVLQHLLKIEKITLRDAPNAPDTQSPNYNANARCAFHSGAAGHDTERCIALKNKVQDLLDQKVIQFTQTPNIVNNLIPTHGDSGVNAIENEGMSVVSDVGRLTLPLLSAKQYLIDNGIIPDCGIDCVNCKTQPEGCDELKSTIQKLTNEGPLQFYRKLNKRLAPIPEDLNPIKFVSGGVIQDGQVNAIVNGEEVDSDCEFDSWIRPSIPGEMPSNWTIEDVIQVAQAQECPTTTDSIGNSSAIAYYDFDNPIYQAEEEAYEDCDLPDELARLLKQEEKKAIQPHQEEIEMVNVGTKEQVREVKIGAVLENSVKQRLIVMLKEYADIFVWSYEDMPGLDTDIVVHRLPLKEDSPPVKQKLRRTRPDMSEKIKKEVEKQFDAGFLQVVNYPPWVANIVPVPKKDGKVRMCVDYRDLNRASPKDDFPLPHIDVLVDNTAPFKVFSFMDGFSGYNQIKMAPEDMEKTTFITPWGTFCYKVMPFGLKNAGATYQRAMVTLFHDMIHKEIEVYVDDMIAKSHTEEEHLVHLQKLFERLREFRLRLNPNKCTFGVRSGKLLGFVVSGKGIEVDPAKIKAIQEMPEPRTEKEVRGFLGRLNYIARFISHLTATCEPIFKLLRKDQTARWNNDCQRAFEKVKEYLQEPPILMPPVPGRPLIMYLTVLENSMGCVLGQHDESGRKEHAIYYLSKKFTDCESRYSLLEKTCCALVWAARRLRQYMLVHTTLLISKMDPIKYVFEKPALSGRVARWQMILTEYDIQYTTQKAIKGSVLADYLAHQPVEDYEPMKFEFPDEDVLYIRDCNIPGPEEGPEPGSRWTLVFDGASNALGNGVGAVITSPSGFHIPFTARICFDCTNNMAEYEACIYGIEAAIDLRIKYLKVYGDSNLVISQINGDWETRHQNLIPYREHVMRLIPYFDEITFEHISREENNLADALATLASMFKVKWANEAPNITINRLDEPAFCFEADVELDGNPWYHDIKKFLETQEYPPEASVTDKKFLRRFAAKFYLNGGVLYKRHHDGVLLRCVVKEEASKIIEEMHEGEFGTHSSGHTMAKKILRAGYYWSTMETDCHNHVRICHKCQIYADKVHVPPVPLNVLTSPWPFAMWGIDMIGEIKPTASNGHRFILVAIDYFTKWVEAASYANVTKQVITRFIKHNIICRYGIPEKIITDNGSNLNNKLMKELCESFKIKHHNSSPYRPKMNGAVEAANKNIKKIVQKMVVTYRDWHEMLPFALHGYRTSVRTSTGATPFSLVYGMEAVLPVEVEIPSLRIMKDVELDESEWVQNRLDQLNLIDEKRLAAIGHGQVYQKKMRKAFDKRVRPQSYKPGDLVLKRIILPQGDPRGKWTPTYEGPFVVQKVFSGGAMMLATMDGENFPHPVNADVVKKYFA
ncbi:uncharacterized protein LOC131594738 [Vicia villosa]|uniref:uncharacterized protein LOC131594738 n=1 Tax=Vicia villosa TaxID=3911 RepID=UPI00273AB944|nr:uncharacterized protein LOC131594738 [Vicia villosa]